MRISGSWMPLLLALAVGVATVAGACGREEAAEETAAAEEGVEVTGLTLGRAVGPDKRVTDETTTFAPTETIYVSVETEGVDPGAELTARWMYEDGQEVDTDRLTISTNGPEVTEFHVSKPDGWPTGGYEVVILLDGQEVDRLSFVVEGGD